MTKFFTFRLVFVSKEDATDGSNNAYFLEIKRRGQKAIYSPEGYWLSVDYEFE